SPHFGERWGRHWLDKARYADSDGYEKDRPRPNAWRYRDWVIEALNRDMAFDQFSIEQIAGDLLPNSSPIERLATAFNRQTLTNTEGGVDQEEFRVLAIKDRINTLGTVWLGLTVGCADCHSHKYDPITQREYYQLFAFFNNADEINTELPNSDKPVRVIGQRTSNPRKSHVLRRGDFLQPAAEVEPAALELLHPLSARNREGAPDRLDLAEWLVDPANPLTPRVVVNHIWTHLFGWGLVTTVSDFGVRGAPPTHPRLLDWLATELIERGWSRKSMIKLIVSSATYRQSSRHRPDLANTDSLNNLLARQNRFRVDAEIVRDLYLAASGLLTQKIGGPSVYPPMPADVAELSYANNFKWTTSKGDNRYRRGMYTFFKRTSPHPNLIAFDCPDANTTNVQRWASNTPIQALTTLNNEVFVEAAQAMARRVLTAAAVSTDADRITYAFRLCVARAPSEADRNRFVRLLLKARAWYGERPEPARELVGRYQPDGVTPVEAAAWVATARILLNMDEFITRE
ncbi:MAG: DUF1553 domain-containing protein, partial [Planctomycetes bacterium]|nr:DUF1553 domain-containing protein [Planctomycetota bacterium]